MLAIGAWAACTAAISAYGLDRIASARTTLLRAMRPADGAPSPSASPSPSAGTPVVLRTPGGNVVAGCESGTVRVQYLSPAAGYHIESADRAPAAESHVTFKTNGREVRVVVRCAADGPHADVTLG